MSDLFGSLALASRALDAQRTGLDIVGQNIANVNTAGYSRRVVDIATVAPANSALSENGADVVSIRALRDRLLDRRLLVELPTAEREAAMAEALALVESSLGAGSGSVDKSLEAFFNAFANLAEEPSSAIARNEVQVQGQALAGAFSGVASRLEAARRDTDRQIGAVVDEINSLAARIAVHNRTLSTVPAESGLTVRDEQAMLVRRLSELVGVQVIEHESGAVDISIAGGRALVVGEYVYAVDTAPAPGTGYLQITTGGVDVTAQITAGRLGGLLNVRDEKIPAYLSRLDTVAWETAQQVNALHAAGFDLDGGAGGAFFTFPPSIVDADGAAAAMSLSAAIAGDPRLIAAAGINASGDNQIARDIAGLRHARVLEGGTSTLSDGWGELVYAVGSDTRFAKDERNSRDEVVRQIDALRDEVSGVSLDEEAMHMLKFQRAYEAIARFFSTVNQSLDTLLNLVR